MKALTVIAAVAVVAFIGWWLASPESRSDRSHQTASTQTSHPPTTTNTDATEVFQKAFWKRPTANDKILHAERREWANDAGVQKWSWFIAVQPSPELVKHLREDNAFSLSAVASVKPVENAPTWFVSDGDVLQSPQGNMRLIFSKTDNILYATDSGGGFRPGAPEPAKPFPQTASAGRLPTTPPPKP